MALLKCPDCGREVSSHATACPNCGCPVSYIMEQDEANAPAEECLAESSMPMEACKFKHNDGIETDGTVSELSDFSFVNGVLESYLGSAVDVVIPDGIQSIKHDAFPTPSHLRSIYIPRSVTTIEPGTFAWCDQLYGIIVDPQNLKYAAENGMLFSKDKTILYAVLPTVCGQITIPDCVKEIADQAFYNCCGVTSMIVPPSVRKVGSLAFYRCRKLKKVVTSDGLEFGQGVFRGCISLSDITLPNDLCYINSAMFCGCTNLKRSSI